MTPAAETGAIPAAQAGSIAFACAVRVRVSGAALCALATDLPAYVRAEPRLRAAEWVAGRGQAVGASARIVADLPFSAAIVERIVGPPRGTATLEELVPGASLAYSLETGKARGYLRAEFEDVGGGTVVRAAGWVCPRSAAGRLSLRPATPVLGHLLGRAVARAVVRAAAALGSPGEAGTN